MEKLAKFVELGVSENILHALKKKGFESPSPIQEQIIPLLLQGDKDIIGQAQTGTGKTAAFGIPLIEKLTQRSNTPQALILVPTRELAIQVSDEINSLKGKSPLSINPVYGGQSISIQIQSLRRGIDIVVGTPGRILDLINRKVLLLDKISFLILDEADEMLNMGFIDDVETIMKETPSEKRTLLFSATMPDTMKRIAQKYMNEFVHVATKREELNQLTEQVYFEVRLADKFEALCRIIDLEVDFYGIIFCRTKLDVDEISTKLNDRGYNTEGLHGDITQGSRERILNKFRAGKTNILVATDVAARGIDVSDLTHVINYAIPQDPEAYVHRIGRTGRAGKKGTAITFITPSEYRRLMFIQRAANINIKRKNLPNAAEVIAIKKANIQHKLSNILEEKENKDCLDLAGELLKDKDPLAVIASLIQHLYADDLNENNYREIRATTEASESSVDKQGRARLFVALGRIDNLTPAKLVKHISDEAKVPGHCIQDIRIMETFSFITLPFQDAERVMDAFAAGRQGRTRPLVTKAKEKSR